MIKAIEKAEALEKHRVYLGVPVSEFEVTLTVKEAFELLDWYLTQDHLDLNLEVLAADVMRARLDRDPWVVLQHFTLRGFKIVKLVRRR